MNTLFGMTFDDSVLIRVGSNFITSLQTVDAIGTHIVTYGTGEKCCCQWYRFSYLLCYCLWCCNSRPSSSTPLNSNISEAGRPILIKYYV